MSKSAITDTIEMLGGWAQGESEQAETALARLASAQGSGVSPHPSEVEQYVRASNRARVASTVMDICKDATLTTDEAIVDRIFETATDMITGHRPTNEGSLGAIDAAIQTNATWQDVYQICIGKL